MCPQETSSTDDENTNICRENEDFSEFLSHSNSQGTDDSSSDDVSEDELKLLAHCLIQKSGHIKYHFNCV